MSKVMSVACPVKVPEAYCTGCGSVLVPTKCKLTQYRAGTGKERYQIELTCPNRTWRDLFSGHHEKYGQLVEA